jgi:hypothetical protein
MATVLVMTRPLPPVSETNPRLALIEVKLGESLADMVTARRDQGLSWARIAAELYQRTDLYVTGEAIRLWADRAGSAA